MRHEIRNIDSSVKKLREFGLVVGGVLVLFGAFAMWRGKGFYPHLYAVGSVLVIFGAAAPGLLKPVQKAWMALAIIIGFFMSRLLLTLLFYGVMTPIGLAMKLFGKDTLDERIEKGKASYWQELPTGRKVKEHYERQY
jgi:multisubunit Na+/H+ antiporter MnhG subunit